MRVTFPRLADHQRGYAVVERDDGVVYRMDSFTTMGPDLPHDVRHFASGAELLLRQHALGLQTRWGFLVSVRPGPKKVLWHGIPGWRSARSLALRVLGDHLRDARGQLAQ